MSRFSIGLALTVCALLAALPATARAQGDSHTTRRFAIIVGSNHGGAARTELRFAQRDARAVAAVLEQLGGVDHRDRILLLEPSPEQLQIAFSQLQTQARLSRERGQRTELLFYYSGHSDEEGLMLGEERVNYRQLRDGLASVGASVHVGVLDSCASGALTRLKGGERRAPFLLDKSNAVQGHAFLTSASADEGAQESDRVGASFFTHYLVSGLRGAADFSGDGRVTLNEAYRFAFDETLARTEGTHAGPQHASYDIQLVGTGDLVMTDLRQPAAALQIPKQLSGRMFLRDSRGNLVVELNKPAGRQVELALDAQSYQILLDQDGKLSRAGIELPANTTTILSMASFVAVEGQVNRLRGDDMVEPRDDCAKVTFGFGLFDPMSTNSRYRHAGPYKPACIKNNVGIHLVWGRVDQLQGVSIALGGTQVLEHAQGALIAVGATHAKQLEGAEIAVGVNIVERLKGAQLGVGPNLVLDHYTGAQIALVNLAKKGNGVQFGIVNGAFEMHGGQLGLVNTVHSFEGVQGGLVNVVTGADASGFQGGLVNVVAGKNASGMQVGLVNVSAGELDGGQIGLFNYADKADAQVGLLSGTRQGGVHAVAFMSDAIPMQLGARFDSEHTFALLLGGISPEKGKETYSFGFGFGGKILLHDKLWLEPTLDAQYLAIGGEFDEGYEGDEGGPSSMARVSLDLRYQLHEHVSVFAAPVFQVFVHPGENNHGERPGLFDGAWELTAPDSNAQVLGSVGFKAGVML
jgi:hypothetical protein